MIKLRKFQTPFPNPYDYGQWRACPGAFRSEDFDKAQRGIREDIAKFANRLTARSFVDRAWIVCLVEAEIIDRETAKTLLGAICKLIEKDSIVDEQSLIEALGGDEDLGGLVNLGRTQQEPMSRFKMRDQALDFCGFYIELLETVAAFIKKNKDTVMIGHTHMSQGQPVTLASYFLSVFDNLQRAFEQIETAYKFINRNTGGCGSTSGITWPVDRYLLTELLGFDELVEPAFDCEASQDHSTAFLFAISSAALILSKTAMDIEIWGMEEFGTIKMPPGWVGQSSYMPQKAHPGSRMEIIRSHVNTVLSSMNNAVTTVKGEPHSDLLTMISVPAAFFDAVPRAKAAIRIFGDVLKNIQPQKDKMMEYARESYSCASEIVAYMVKELGYGPRRAHRIAATFVRIAREENIPAYKATGALLDKAAESVEEEPPRISDETLGKLLDPVNFIETHSNIGGTAPQETERMLSLRMDYINKAKERQKERVQRRDAGLAKLDGEVSKILKG